MANNVSELVKRANQLAAECEKKKDYKQAIELYIKAINLDPKNTLAVTSLCAIYFNMGRHDVVEKILLEAIKIAPNNCYFHFQLGQLYTTERKFEKSVKYFLKAHNLNKNLKELYLNLAHAYTEMHEYVKALEFAREGIEKYPDYAKLYNNLAFILRATGDVEEAFKYQKIAIEKQPDDFALYSNLLYFLSQSETITPKQFLEYAKEYGRRVTQGVQPFSEWPELYANTKIRIGLVSGDFRNHPVTFFIENWLGFINREEFELVAYYTYFQSDSKTEGLKKYFKEWYKVSSLTNRDLAEKVYNDRVNILIDLSGHTAHNRLPSFAWKPAPIQISWIGLPCTTGVKQIDYIMPTKEMSPPEFDKHYVEKPWYLSIAGGIKPPDFKIEVNKLPALDNGFITFGCFHSFTKLTDQVLKTWSEILKRVPNSKLFFKCKELKEHRIQDRLLENMIKFGIAEDRIIIEGPSPLEEYFGSYHSIDIGLDPFPYNSGTLGYHSLWMGVPFIALIGDRLASRVGYSALYSVGLDDLAADTSEQYINKAVELAENTNKLKTIRSTLRKNALDSNLFSGEYTAGELTEVFKKMWKSFKNNH